MSRLLSRGPRSLESRTEVTDEVTDEPAALRVRGWEGPLAMGLPAGPREAGPREVTQVRRGHAGPERSRRSGVVTQPAHGILLP